MICKEAMRHSGWHCTSSWQDWETQVLMIVKDNDTIIFIYPANPTVSQQCTPKWCRPSLWILSIREGGSSQQSEMVSGDQWLSIAWPHIETQEAGNLCLDENWARRLAEQIQQSRPDCGFEWTIKPAKGSRPESAVPEQNTLVVPQITQKIATAS